MSVKTVPRYLNKEDNSIIQALQNDGANDHILEMFVFSNCGTEVPRSKKGQWVAFNDNPTDPEFWILNNLDGYEEEIFPADAGNDPLAGS